MVPNVIINGKEISMYVFAALAGFLLLLLVVYKLAKSKGLDEIIMLITTLWGAVGILIGGHIMYGFTQLKLLGRVLANIGKQDFSIIIRGFMLVFGGSVFYGGLIGALLAGFIYLRKKKVTITDYTDISAVGIPLFHFFGRIGCFLSGCCYGVECSVGFVYHYSPVEAANGVRRFPVQLVEAAVNLFLFAVLFYLVKKGIAKGKILNVYLFAYPVCRFILEYFRGDEYRGFIMGLSTSQFVSVLLIAANAGYLVWKKQKKANK